MVQLPSKLTSDVFKASLKKSLGKTYIPTEVIKKAREQGLSNALSYQTISAKKAEDFIKSLQQEGIASKSRPAKMSIKAAWEKSKVPSLSELAAQKKAEAARIKEVVKSTEEIIDLRKKQVSNTDYLENILRQGPDQDNSGAKKKDSGETNTSSTPNTQNKPISPFFEPVNAPPPIIKPPKDMSIG